MYEAEFMKRNPTHANGTFKGKFKNVDIKKLQFSKLKIPPTEYTVKAKSSKRREVSRRSR